MSGLLLQHGLVVGRGLLLPGLEEEPELVGSVLSCTDDQIAPVIQSNDFLSLLLRLSRVSKKKEVYLRSIFLDSANSLREIGLIRVLLGWGGVVTDGQGTYFFTFFSGTRWQGESWGVSAWTRESPVRTSSSSSPWQDISQDLSSSQCVHTWRITSLRFMFSQLENYSIDKKRKISSDNVELSLSLNI